MTVQKKNTITLGDLAMMVKHGFDSVDKRFTGVDNRFDKLEDRFDTLEDKVDSLEDTVVRSHQRRIEKVEIITDKIKQALAIH